MVLPAELVVLAVHAALVVVVEDVVVVGDVVVVDNSLDTVVKSDQIGCKDILFEFIFVAYVHLMGAIYLFYLPNKLRISG